MPIGLRVRLCSMMFLQYFVWGIWLTVMGLYLSSSAVGLKPSQIGWIYTVYGFGAILGPLVLGQLADRYLATEVVMALAHLIGGVLLIATAYVTGFWSIFGLLFLYCNLYMPTMGLANSISFRVLGDGNQDRFPGIRLWGTIGWIAAGLFLTWYLESAGKVSALRPLFELIGMPALRDIFRLAGVVSMLYGLYCFTLPHTPPTRVVTDSTVMKKSAIAESLALLRFRSFAVLVLVAGLIGIMLAFYFACENEFLKSLGIQESRISSYMTIGQVAEVVLIGIIPIAVHNLGVKRTMILGAGAWALRFGLSAYGQPNWLMIATIGLHGFAFGFFFVVAQMYVDRAAGPDIKASAQNLLIFVIYGLGTIVGSILAGYVREFFLDDQRRDNWHMVWAGPTVLTLLCIVIFVAFFRDVELKKGAPIEAEPALV